MSSFNKSHPELQEGEVFLQNIPGWCVGMRETRRFYEVFRKCLPGWPTNPWLGINHTTKRLGRVAYDIHDKPLTDMLPVFVQRAELIDKGIDLDKL